MKIAIIGAGFFGSTIALKLSEQHTVHLYEKENNILNGASKVNLVSSGTLGSLGIVILTGFLLTLDLAITVSDG